MDSQHFNYLFVLCKHLIGKCLGYVDFDICLKHLRVIWKEIKYFIEVKMMTSHE